MGIIKPATRTHQNPGPWLQVRVLTGTGAGCSGKPQGSPLRSLGTVQYNCQLSLQRFQQHEQPPALMPHFHIGLRTVPVNVRVYGRVWRLITHTVGLFSTPINGRHIYGRIPSESICEEPLTAVWRLLSGNFFWLLTMFHQQHWHLPHHGLFNVNHPTSSGFLCFLLGISFGCLDLQHLLACWSSINLKIESLKVLSFSFFSILPNSYYLLVQVVIFFV